MRSWNCCAFLGSHHPHGIGGVSFLVISYDWVTPYRDSYRYRANVESRRFGIVCIVGLTHWR